MLKEEMNHLPLLDALIDNENFGLTLSWELLQRTLIRRSLG
jgi:hypothetical protein